MNDRLLVGIAIIAFLCGSSCRRTAPASVTSAPIDTPTGKITGHVRLMGMTPENPVIRMRADPMCDKANGGRRVFQETSVVSSDGSLANVFVQLQGDFPATATSTPTEPVNIDQLGCVYLPRMVGVRVGQPLRVHNSDPGLHNVHGVSPGRDEFNIGQPLAGMVNEVRLKDEGILRLQCDVHTWMVAYIGVVSHPYFAVTGPAGAFELRDVPVGTYAVRAWHELYGARTSSVRVDAGSAAVVDFAYSGDEKPATVQSLSLDGDSSPTRSAPPARP
jgi:hypothetical protein